MKRRPLKYVRRPLRWERRPLPPRYQPSWQGVFENWTRKWVTSQYWRVASLVDSDEDAIQECAVVFTKCCNKYGDVVNNPAWFMSLYMRSVSNTWNSMALRDHTARVEKAEYVSHALTGLSPDVHDDNLGPVMVALHNISDDARIVLQKMMMAPKEVIEFVFSRPRHPVAINRRMTRLCGISHSQVNVIEEISEFVRKS